MKKVIGIGNSLVDILIKLDSDDWLKNFDLPKGSMTLVDAEKSVSIYDSVKSMVVQKSAGGSAANTINGLSKLGVGTAFIGKTGKDEIGDFFVNDLKNNNVESKMFRSDTSAGKALALISEDSERTFATYLGASIELSETDLNEELFKNYDICYIEGYLVQNHSLIESACKLAKQNNCEICLDLASYNVVEENIEFLKRIVKEYVDILFANEEEAKAFTGMDPEKALDNISDDVKIAIVKVGKKGSMIKCSDKIYNYGIIPAKAVDTTGAGDLYAAGFLYGYINGYEFDKCANIGAITSGHIVEVIGAKMSDKVWSEIKSQIDKV